MSLREIKLPPSVSEIGGCAFYDCSSLQSIEIPPGVETLATHTFSGCTSLRSVTISSSVVTIGGYAFSACSSLIAVFIPMSVTHIGNGAFQGCSCLSSIAIPSSVQFIGFRAFHHCDQLEKAVPDTKQVTPWLKQRFSNLPLQQACYSPETNYNSEAMHKQAILLMKRNRSLIQAQDKLGLTALHLVVCNPKVENNVIRLLLQICPDLAHKSDCNGLSPLALFLRCKGFAFDEKIGRLSLFDALKQGIQLHDLKHLLVLDQKLRTEQLKKDRVNHFYPFIIAAGSKQCNLDIVYTLARDSVQLLRP